MTVSEKRKKYIMLYLKSGDVYDEIYGRLLGFGKSIICDKVIKILDDYGDVYYINFDKCIYWVITDGKTSKEFNNKLNSEDVLKNIDNVNPNELNQEEFEEAFQEEFQDCFEESFDENLKEEKKEIQKNTNQMLEETLYDILKNLSELKKANVSVKNYILEFINKNFQGANITVHTKSSKEITGEVIYSHDFILVLKSQEKTYYINPNQIIYFS